MTVKLRHGVYGAVLAAAFAGSPALADMSADGQSAVTVFGARMTDNSWNEIVLFDDVDVRDAWLAGVALSRELTGTEHWALEAEAQGVRHFGNQDHWELNALLVGRWRSFPWNATLPTSVAFGIGPSYATEVPPEEVARHGESARFLVYWMAELEVGLPESPWSAIARLHHRSSAFGLVADDGGSNWLTLGVRRRF